MPSAQDPTTIEKLNEWIKVMDQAGAFQLAVDLREAVHEIQRVHALINTPHTDNFLEAVRLEAAHQREVWAAEHDAGKTDADWFWLIGYLAGKAIRPDATPEKRLHHIITTAAACLNWHAHRTGADTRMRPGIDPPTDTTTGHGPYIIASRRDDEIGFYAISNPVWTPDIHEAVQFARWSDAERFLSRHLGTEIMMAPLPPEKAQ